MLVAPSLVAPGGGLVGWCGPQGLVTKRMGLRGWPPREWGLRGWARGGTWMDPSRCALAGWGRAWTPVCRPQGVGPRGLGTSGGPRRGWGVGMGRKGEGRNRGPKWVGPWLVRAGGVELGPMGVH